MNQIDEAVTAFLVESLEGIDQLDRDLVNLEQAPNSRELLSGIFRVLHTIKGSASMLGFHKLETLSHAAENLLSRLRDGHLTLNAEMTSALLQMCDCVRQMLAAIESTSSEGHADHEPLIATLTRLRGSFAPAPPKQPETSAEVAPKNSKNPAGASSTPQHTQSASQTPLAAPTNEAPASAKGAESSDLLGGILVQRGVATEAEIARALSLQREGDIRPLGEILVGMGVAKQADVADCLQLQADCRAGLADSTIRVDVSLLDKLMNLVGELVLARNQILQFTAGRDNPAFVATSQRLNLITTELQEGVMKTRMQPIGNVWSKFPRIVRDLAIACEKNVRVEMEGTETELDKTIIEAIKAPLTHIVRNSVDHGIEPPQVRLAANWSVEATLHLACGCPAGQPTRYARESTACTRRTRTSSTHPRSGLPRDRRRHFCLRQTQS